MHRFRKGLSVVLAALLICTLCVQSFPVAAAEVILDPKLASGSNYTVSGQLAAALDRVFAGDVDIFSDAACTAEVSMPLGTSMNNSTQYYVKSKTSGNKISGWQCYIYANGVYNQLFQEWVGHANGFAHSEKVVPGGGNALSYEILKGAAVRCGAYLRTTGNSDGSYSSNIGHSMIILSYDQSSITYLEGNADGNGLVRITTRTWSDFNQRQLSGKSRYICHIAQPKAAFYDSLYPACPHGQYDGSGNCTECGGAFDWEVTFNAGAAGQYQVLEDTKPGVEAPYDDRTSATVSLYQGEILEVTGSCQNAFGEQWYVYTGTDGNRYFVKAEHLLFVETVTLQVVCADFSPVDESVLEQKSQPVKGTVTSNYPIKALYAYLDGEQYATWTASNQQTTTVNLQATDVNYKLTFSTMAKGRHTITLKLVSFLHDDPVVIHESVFYMVEKTPDSQGGQVTLRGTVESAFDESSPTVVRLGQGDTWIAETVITGLKGTYAFPNLDAGTYILEVQKAGAVTLSLTLQLEQGLVTQDAVLCPPGDVNGDGMVNVGDSARLYAHIRGNDLISRHYTLQCADFDGDGTVSIGDVGKLYAYVKNNG